MPKHQASHALSTMWRQQAAYAGVGHVPLDPADQCEGVVRMAALIVTSTVTPHRSATLGTAIAGPPDRYGASCLRPAPRERGKQGAQHPAPNLSRATPGRLDGWHDGSMGSVPAGASATAAIASTNSGLWKLSAGRKAVPIQRLPIV